MSRNKMPFVAPELLKRVEAMNESGRSNQDMVKSFNNISTNGWTHNRCS